MHFPSLHMKLRLPHCTLHYATLLQLHALRVVTTQHQNITPTVPLLRVAVAEHSGHKGQ